MYETDIYILQAARSFQYVNLSAVRYSYFVYMNFSHRFDHKIYRGHGNIDNQYFTE